MKYKVVAERTFTIDYEVIVEADSEESARVLVEQCNEDIDDWEGNVFFLDNFDERTPKVIEITEQEGQLNA